MFYIAYFKKGGIKMGRLQDYDPQMNGDDPSVGCFAIFMGCLGFILPLIILGIIVLAFMILFIGLI